MGLTNERELREIAALGKVWLSGDEHTPDCDGNCGADPVSMTIDGGLIYHDCRDDARIEFRHRIESLMEQYGDSLLREELAGVSPPGEDAKQ